MIEESDRRILEEMEGRFDSGVSFRAESEILDLDREAVTSGVPRSISTRNQTMKGLWKLVIVRSMSATKTLRIYIHWTELSGDVTQDRSDVRYEDGQSRLLRTTYGNVWSSIGTFSTGGMNTGNGPTNQNSEHHHSWLRTTSDSAIASNRSGLFTTVNHRDSVQNDTLFSRQSQRDALRMYTVSHIRELLTNSNSVSTCPDSSAVNNDKDIPLEPMLPAT
ncbi:hypothetical protein FQR65_LT20572 [Abscondita terminalis]|nr:hypothetical protein FQR65_LT20572 [Abscondita terminalis]